MSDQMGDMYDIVVPLVAKWEGFVASPYFCPAWHLTIGYGNIIQQKKYYGKYDGRQITRIANLVRARTRSRRRINEKLKRHFGIMLNVPDALLMLEIRLKEFWRRIAPSLPRGMSDAQCAAVLSLAYNIGVAAFKRSSVLRHLKNGHLQASADAFLMWKKITVNGRRKVSKGLLNRRHAERALFLGRG